MTLCGTDEWMAPEVMLGEKYDEKADVFSFGMVVIELITRKKPAKRTPGNKYAVEVPALKALVPRGCPNELVQIAIDCTEWAAGKRITMKDAGDRLRALFATLPEDQVQVKKSTNIASEINYMSSVVVEEEDDNQPNNLHSSGKHATRHIKATGELGHKVHVIKDYEAQDDVELSFKKGDIINWKGSDDSGWSQGELRGKVGWFPTATTEGLEKKDKKPNSGSIIENKEGTKKNLDNFLNQRPPPAALEQKGIVADPNTKKDQKRTTIDVLSSFFSKTKKDKDVKEKPDIRKSDGKPDKKPTKK